MLPGLSLNSSRIHEFVTYVLQQCGGTFVFKGPWFGSLDSLLTSNPANHFSEQRQEVDMKEVLKRFLFDFVCLLMLGFDPNSLSIEFPRVPYKQAYYDMEEVIFQRNLKPQWFWEATEMASNWGREEDENQFGDL
ncbi:hypothetical protein OIU78_030003 [Salix suchowensis]|nr:hypothetical protein OIU78_030003 [Salix suchowensis]